MPRNEAATRSWSVKRLPPWFSVTDHAHDGRKLPPQRALDLVDPLVHLVHRQLWIHLAVEVDDLAARGLAHAHVVDPPDEPDAGGDFGQRRAHRGDVLRRGV